ncbi:MAG: hypothetical protein WCB68_19410 [Pyrinomonadaceae bacterium]
MLKQSRSYLFALAALFLLLSCQTQAKAQRGPVILSGAELTRVVPTSFYFQGQSGPTQMRNSAAARLGANRYVIAGLVDTSGYSSDVRGTYEGFFITDSPVIVGGSELETGAYGFGFSADGKMNIFDLGGRKLMSVDAQQDQQLRRPRPLMMSAPTDALRLYHGRNYVTIGAR